MRGRKPKPAAVRALHGSRTRPHHRDQLPPDEPPIAAPPKTIAAPPGITSAELRYWDYFAPLLTAAKVLTPADVQTLADYCRACVAVDERGKRLRKALRPKRVVVDGKRVPGELDQRLVRMLDSQMRGWMERKTKLAGELGLTAISRTRVGWTGYARVPDAKPSAPSKPTTKLSQLQEQAASLRRPIGVRR